MDSSAAGDAAIVAVQIGRKPRSEVEVAARCHLDVPVVIAVPPNLDDGTPFPTHYWLTCPLAARRIGRIEAAGGVAAADSRIAADPEFAASFRDANRRYAAQRDSLVRDDVVHVPSGGVGGSSGGVKCLHAHYADHAAGNANPVGADVASDVEPLDCTVRCVVDAGSGAAPNPEWREPRPRK